MGYVYNCEHQRSCERFFISYQRCAQSVLEPLLDIDRINNEIVPPISRYCRITLMSAFFCNKIYNELKNSFFVNWISARSNLSILSISISALSNSKNYGVGRLVKYEPHSSCFTEARFTNILSLGGVYK